MHVYVCLCVYVMFNIEMINPKSASPTFGMCVWVWTLDETIIKNTDTVHVWESIEWVYGTSVK